MWLELLLQILTTPLTMILLMNCKICIICFIFAGITLGLHLLMVLITVILLAAGYDILPLELSALPLDIRDDPDYLRGIAWQERWETDDNGIIDRNALADANQTERSVLYQKIEIFFEAKKKSGNVFSKENLELIQEVENEFFLKQEYQDHFCLSNGTQCIKPSSVLRYFDGTYAGIDTVFHDPNFDNIVNVLFAAENNNATKKSFQQYLGKDAVIDGNVAESQITLSILYLGWPLKGYANDSDRESDQETEIEDYLVDEFVDRADHYFDKGVGKNMNFFYYNQAVLIVVIQGQVLLDLGLAIGSMVFIVIFMCIQTGSFWVTLWAILSILCGFFTTNLFYRIILDFRYLGVFHILAVFIILGIGADDVFVMYDTWKESEHKKYSSLAHRMSDVYQKSAIAMLYTSLTTAVAFIVSAFSPFLGVYTFGVFAGVLVIINYLSVILFFPTVILTYHLYWERFKCCCCCPRYDRSDDPNRENPEIPKKNFVVRFLAGPYFRMMTHRVARWIWLILFWGVFTLFLVFCFKLEVDEEQVGFGDESPI